MFSEKKLMFIAATAAAALILGAFASWLLRRSRRRLGKRQFQERWQKIQGLCGKSETWPLAVMNADTLLDDVLKQSKYKGKTMGERLVAAQRDLSDNDGVWFGHKLRNKIAHEELVDLQKKEVQNALRGYREALKDLGAIE